MLEDEHSFPFTPLVWEVYVNLVEVGLYLKFVVSVVTLSAPKSSNSSNNNFCLWYRQIYKKVLSKSVLCVTFNLPDCIWVSICTAPQRESAFCSSPSCMPVLFLLVTRQCGEGRCGEGSFSDVLIKSQLQAGTINLGLRVWLSQVFLALLQMQCCDQHAFLSLHQRQSFSSLFFSYSLTPASVNFHQCPQTIVLLSFLRNIFFLRQQKGD